MTTLVEGGRADRGFERLYRRHAGDVYRYALALLQNASDAEDVTQTTFLNAYRALERGDRPRAPRNWLIAIAHNVCRQRFRQSARRPAEVAWEDSADRLVDDESPSSDDIRRALSHLPFNQRAALVMRELHGRSYAEIAEALGLSLSAVETLLFRARRAMREQLDGALTCSESELAISKQLDGQLARAEKGALRAHLRECPECAAFARRQRSQRRALRALGAVPLPASIVAWIGGGGSAAGVVATKTAAVVAAAALAGGTSYEVVRRAVHPAGPAVRPAAPVHRSGGVTPAGAHPGTTPSATVSSATDGRDRADGEHGHHGKEHGLALARGRGGDHGKHNGDPKGEDRHAVFFGGRHVSNGHGKPHDRGHGHAYGHDALIGD